MLLSDVLVSGWILRSRFSVHLVRVLLALCLAWTVAIFPIAAPHAHAQQGHSRHGQVHLSQGHDTSTGAHAHKLATSDHPHASSTDSCAGPHDSKCGGETPTCCGTIACHVFLRGVTPDLRMSRQPAKIACSYFEEQADGLSPSSLDRPPRSA
jgi:hypothetical protein